eukprot:scaffold79988_cov63-Phaeocystis_antarctica.AAC.9
MAHLSSAASGSSHTARVVGVVRSRKWPMSVCEGSTAVRKVRLALHSSCRMTTSGSSASSRRSTLMRRTYSGRGWGWGWGLTLPFTLTRSMRRTSKTAWMPRGSFGPVTVSRRFHVAMRRCASPCSGGAACASNSRSGSGSLGRKLRGSAARSRRLAHASCAHGAVHVVVVGDASTDDDDDVGGASTDDDEGVGRARLLAGTEASSSWRSCTSSCFSTQLSQSMPRCASSCLSSRMEREISGMESDVSPIAWRRLRAREVCSFLHGARIFFLQPHPFILLDLLPGSISHSTGPYSPDQGGPPDKTSGRQYSAAQPRAAELLYSRLSDPGSNQFSLQVSVHTTLNVTDPPRLNPRSGVRVGPADRGEWPNV